MLPSATKVDAHFDALPDDRRRALHVVRATILANLPAGYEEAFDGRFVSYQVPLTVYRDTYNARPLMYAALANQGAYMAVYLCNVYALAPLRKELEAGFRAAGKRLDMGKSCVRFKTLGDLPLEVIARMIAATPMENFVALARKAHSKAGGGSRRAPESGGSEEPVSGRPARPASAATRARASGSRPRTRGA
jgi:hypothetical protein